VACVIAVRVTFMTMVRVTVMVVKVINPHLSKHQHMLYTDVHAS
jgi:hypothetical protein